MGKGVRVKLSRAGARAILASDGVRADLLARAERIAARANSMVSEDEMRNDAFMASDDASNSHRARAHVYTASDHGVYAQNKNNVLLKALDEGR